MLTEMHVSPRLVSFHALMKSHLWNLHSVFYRKNYDTRLFHFYPGFQIPLHAEVRGQGLRG